MLECSKDTMLQPGTWNLWTTGKRRILFSCPKCGQVALLDHEISGDGTVTPSVECAKPGCSFHDDIRLVGWATEQKDADE